MNLRNFGDRLKRGVKPLLWHDDLRALVGRARYTYYARLRRGLRTREAELGIDRTVSHNLLGLADHRGVRMKRLLAPLVTIETIGPESDILVVGPRTESDLLLLGSLGFSLSRIRGVDLISYSPMVDLGDVHALSYPPDRFDVVVCGWTLSYSKAPRVAAAELARVCRPGGVIAVAVEYSEVAAGRPVGGVSYVLGHPGVERINSVAQLQELFGDSVGRIFVSHDAPARRSHLEDALHPDPSSVIFTFENVKPGRTG